MAGKVSIVKGDDGALYLVGEVDGTKHAFASVNASQVAADRVEQGKDEAPEGASSAQLGAYTGPASDLTPSPHLKPEESSAGSDESSSEG